MAWTNASQAALVYSSLAARGGDHGSPLTNWNVCCFARACVEVESAGCTVDIKWTQLHREFDARVLRRLGAPGVDRWLASMLSEDRLMLEDGPRERNSFMEIARIAMGHPPTTRSVSVARRARIEEGPKLDEWF